MSGTFSFRSFDRVPELVYIVHMKYVTASEARKDWFRLLDEVAAGEVVALERKGQRIVLRREGHRARKASVPDYSRLISIKGRDSPERWTWTWSPQKGLVLKGRGRR